MNDSGRRDVGARCTVTLWRSRDTCAKTEHHGEMRWAAIVRVSGADGCVGVVGPWPRSIRICGLAASGPSEQSGETTFECRGARDGQYEARST